MSEVEIQKLGKKAPARKPAAQAEEKPKAAAEKPAAEKPAAEKPAAKKPAARKPAAKKETE
jgi:ribonuclease E